LPGWLTVVSALAVAGILIARRRPVPWTSLITLAAFFLLALSAQRAIVWWGLIAPVVMAGIFADDRVGEEPPQRAHAESSLPAKVIVAALALGVIVLAPWLRGSSYETFLGAAPPGLTEAVRGLPSGSRLMVHQPWGSWFEFAVPDDPVFVDSRIEIVPEAIWKDYGEVGFAGAGWKEVLERWDVDAIVAAPNWELLPYLRSDPAEWRVVYDGDDGTLFQRVFQR
jgi:hypothetical protein